MSDQEKYIEMYKKMHKNPQEFRGTSTKKHLADIRELVERTEAKTILDFGCGKGRQYTHEGLHRRFGKIESIRLYDPAVPAYSKKPQGKYDGVICTDVMEHVPEDAIDEVLIEIMSLASYFVFFNISTRLAKAILPNGENAHCTVKPHDWWSNKISALRTENDELDCIVVLETRKDKDPANIIKEEIE